MPKEVLQRSEKEGITYFFLPRWEASNLVGHGFSSRRGGVSQAPYDELNLGYKGGDRPQDVQENRRRFLNIWKKKKQDLFYGEQVHASKIILVDEKILPAGYGELCAADALITREPGVVLGAFAADCLLIYFLDPKTPAIGLAHAGWRGTMLGIAPGVVRAMQNNFATRAESLQVLMAPAIQPYCYEVGGEVLQAAAAARWKTDFVFWPGKKKNHPYLNLPETNKNMLCRLGIKKENIFISKYCTHCNPDLFYSYRRSGGKMTGSQMGIIFLR
ncbi:MAG: peptidoglycan editing factor PgeF [Firmicutes bacterium]|nr:peptidoglycan editing factor PgeF [Bacillota bacterium]